MEVLKLESVSKIYTLGEEKVIAIDGINLSIQKCDFIALIGPSGSGKSTAMNLVGCLDTATKGNIFLQGKNIQNFHESELAQIRGKQIGFIFQTFNLIPSLDALENVALPITFQNIPRKHRIKKAKELLEQVGLGERMYNLLTHLSGGPRQRD